MNPDSTTRLESQPPPTLLQSHRSLSAQSGCLLLHEVECFCALWHETLLQWVNEFHGVVSAFYEKYIHALYALWGYIKYVSLVLQILWWFYVSQWIMNRLCYIIFPSMPWSSKWFLPFSLPTKILYKSKSHQEWLTNKFINLLNA
jgi:hypothetical protein